jgi:hypothetical protein
VSQIFYADTLCVLTTSRRGRIGQFEHRAGGYQWPNHWFCPYSQSIARVSTELGVVEGFEQGWRCMSSLLGVEVMIMRCASKSLGAGG